MKFTDEAQRHVKLPPGISWAELRENHAKFAVEFGDDFTKSLAVTFWVGPSPDGEHMGVQFRLEDGRVVRASLPAGAVESFIWLCALAGEACHDRVLVRGEAAGSA